MQNKYFNISVSIEKGDDDIFFAYCSELAGCYTQGVSYKEAQENIQEAVNLYLETLNQDEAVAFLSQAPNKRTQQSSFVDLQLTPSRAEKLLLKAGFKAVASKDNHRIFFKDNLRFILPLHSGELLSQQITQEILNLV